MHDVAFGVELDQRRREVAGVELVRQHVLPVEDEHVVVGVDAQAAEATHDPVIGQRLRPSEVGLVMRHVLRIRGMRADNERADNERAERAECHRGARRGSNENA